MVSSNAADGERTLVDHGLFPWFEGEKSLFHPLGAQFLLARCYARQIAVRQRADCLNTKIVEQVEQLAPIRMLVDRVGVAPPDPQQPIAQMN